jgi:hypothetical protein
MCSVIQPKLKVMEHEHQVAVRPIALDLIDTW